MVWIRGVNLGGWLMLERFIVPFQFALTDCHLKGDFCWYPGQISAPPTNNTDYRLCNFTQCKPYRTTNAFGELDFPMDEYNLGLAFISANYDSKSSSGNSSYVNKGYELGAQWLDYHFDNFVTYEHLVTLKEAGVTHVRVPLPHWIFMTPAELQNQHNLPWLAGERRWHYFKRLVSWCREIGGLQVWPDIHTAPGSQNGFDNSGHQFSSSSCLGWQSNPRHVKTSLEALYNITTAIVADGLRDIVTGFGVLNEPFLDCNMTMYRDFIEEGLQIVRYNMGADTSVYVSDLFTARKFNDGEWWLDASKYNNTYLDSHYYHVFAGEPRHLSPRQHIAYACQSEYKATKELSGTASCCYNDPVNLDGANAIVKQDIARYNKLPSQGVKRLVGEWSAAVDVLPVAMLSQMMQKLANSAISSPTEHPTLYQYDRTLSPERIKFMRNFVHAQMLSYEAVDMGDVSSGWFFWTLRMEGGAFAEWDFLRGLKEGWIPNPLPSSDISMYEAYNNTSCNDLIFQTSDDRAAIIQEFPDYVPEVNNWQGVSLNDDVVLSHGESILDNYTHSYVSTPAHIRHGSIRVVVFVATMIVLVVAVTALLQSFGFMGRKDQYEQIH